MPINIEYVKPGEYKVTSIPPEMHNKPLNDVTILATEHIDSDIVVAIFDKTQQKAILARQITTEQLKGIFKNDLMPAYQSTGLKPKFMVEFIGGYTPVGFYPCARPNDMQSEEEIDRLYQNDTTFNYYLELVNVITTVAGGTIDASGVGNAYHSRHYKNGIIEGQNCVIDLTSIRMMSWRTGPDHEGVSVHPGVSMVDKFTKRDKEVAAMSQDTVLMEKMRKMTSSITSATKLSVQHQGANSTSPALESLLQQSANFFASLVSNKTDKVEESKTNSPDKPAIGLHTTKLTLSSESSGFVIGK